MEERIVVADPVKDPHAYQRELLQLLGGRDPLAVLAATPTSLRQKTLPLAGDLLDRSPGAGEWSAADLLGHLWDSEIAGSFRLRLILAQDSPPLAGYDQDAWARLPRPPFGELLDAYAALRNTNLELIRRTPEALWSRAGIHAERGQVSFRMLVETQAGHDRAHLIQLEQTIRAVAH